MKMPIKDIKNGRKNMKIKEVKSKSAPKNSPAKTSKTIKKRPNKYATLGDCPMCGHNKKAVVRQNRSGKTLNTVYRCKRCGKKYSIFKVLGSRVNIKSAS